MCIFIFAEEGNSSGGNVHNHIFSQCQLFNSFFTNFLGEPSIADQFYIWSYKLSGKGLIVFKSTVHKSKAISLLDKLNYWNSLLEVPALRVIGGLSLTEANYKSAVEILPEDWQTSAHSDYLLKIPNCLVQNP